MGTRRSREEWSEIIEAFDASGESLQRFCGRRRIAPKTLGWWRWHLRRLAAEGAAPERVRLVPVELVQEEQVAADTPTAVTIVAGDVEVRFAVGTDVTYVTGLVGALRHPC